MPLFSYRPPHKNKIGLTLSCVCLVIAAILIVSSSFLPQLRSVPQIIGFCFALVSILLITKFVLREFTYAIEEAADGYEFAIYEIQSKRRITVCRIGFSDITDMGDFAGSDAELRSSLGVEKSYSYYPDIAQKGKYYIKATINENDVLVIFAPNDELIETIKKCRRQQKSGDEEFFE